MHLLLLLVALLFSGSETTALSAFGSDKKAAPQSPLSSSNKGKSKVMTATTTPTSTTVTSRTSSSSLQQDVSFIPVVAVPDPNITLKLLLYFFLWYFLTVVYNVSNKIVLNELPLPMTVCAVQLWLGIPVFLPIWLLKRPKLDLVGWWRRYSNIALCHGLGNLASIYSFGAGAVSFTHVVKACEPVFSAVLSRIVLRTEISPAVSLTLVPIVAGVAIASAKELSFTWVGFLSGLASNLFYQLRIVLAKVEMSRPGEGSGSGGVGAEAGGDYSSSPQSPSAQVDKEAQSLEAPSSFTSSSAVAMSPANIFRILTILAALQLTPLALLFEGRTMFSTWAGAVSSGAPVDYLVGNLVVSGVSYYLYNEVAFWILALVTPVTHAIGNTIKRVVIIFASILILKTPVNAQGILGSAIAIAGTLAYSLVLQGEAVGEKRKKSAAQ